MDKRLLGIIGSGERLVDLGCGTGEVLEAAYGAFNERIGLDASFRSDSAVFSDSRRGGAKFLQTDLNDAFPLADHAADVVVANQVIEHIVEPHRFVSEIFRVLRPGGRCVVTTPNIRYLKNIIHIAFSGYGPRTAGGNTLDGAWDDGHLHYFTQRDMRELFAWAGFEDIRSSALIDIRGGRRMRKVMARYPEAFLIREFLSGVILCWGTK